MKGRVKKMDEIRVYEDCREGTVRIELPYGFARGDSEKAVKRKIARYARKIGLVNCWGPASTVLWFHKTSRKDGRRIEQLLIYANGKAIKKTAMNNWGKRNSHRR